MSDATQTPAVQSLAEAYTDNQADALQLAAEIQQTIDSWLEHKASTQQSDRLV